MPTNRRPRRHERREQFTDLTRGIRRTLCHGADFFSAPGIETLRAAWEAHGEDLLDEWIAEHPCSRPFGWWLFVGVPQHGERLQTEALARYASRKALLRYGILHTNTVPSFQEREAVFLERHDLLTPEEIIHLIDSPELRELKAFPTSDSEADA